MDRFEGKVAVITGAASGFGHEFALQGASLGMKLVLADVDATELDATVNALRSEGAHVIGVPTDVSDASQVDAPLATATLDAFGGMHLLFNNAGVGAGGFVWENSANDWQWVFGVNIMGVANGLRAIMPIMLEQNEPAHIVNTASVADLLAAPAMGATTRQSTRSWRSRKRWCTICGSRAHRSAYRCCARRSYRPVSPMPSVRGPPRSPMKRAVHGIAKARGAATDARGGKRKTVGARRGRTRIRRHPR